MKCSSVCELSELDKYQKKYLAGSIMGVKVDSAPLYEWNELLAALGSGPAEDCQGAKNRIISILSA